jgi:antitoxin Phd
MSKEPKKLQPKEEARLPVTSRWQLKTANAQFSEIFRRARANGPQVVAGQDREAVVILPLEEYERLTEPAKQPRSLVKFFADSPLARASLNLHRDLEE